MQLVRYSPTGGLNKIFEPDEAFGLMPAVDSYPLDMYEEKGKLVAEITMPNFAKEEIKITTDTDFLEINAEHKESEEEETDRRYLYRENDNRYMRRIRLPRNAVANEAKATFSDGVLRIAMPLEERPTINEVKVG